MPPSTSHAMSAMATFTEVSQSRGEVPREAAPVRRIPYLLRARRRGSSATNHAKPAARPSAAVAGGYHGDA